MASDQLGCGFKSTAERCGINHRRGGDKSKKRSQRVCPRDPGRGAGPWACRQEVSTHAAMVAELQLARMTQKRGLAHAGRGRESARPAPEVRGGSLSREGGGHQKKEEDVQERRRIEEKKKSTD